MITLNTESVVKIKMVFLYSQLLNTKKDMEEGGRGEVL